MTHSPWWYRYRGPLIFAIYYASFFLAYAVAAAAHLTQVPILDLFGARGERAVFAVATILALAAWVVRSWGASYLDAAVVWNRDARTDRLFVAGPFRYTRNPLYLGNQLLAAAIGCFAPPIGWPIVMFAQWLFAAGLIREEERGLRAQFGAEFERYCARVPRFFPRLLPAAADAGTNAPHGALARAMLYEPLMAGCTAALLVFTIIGGALSYYPWAIAAAGLVAQYALAARRQKQPAL